MARSSERAKKATQALARRVLTRRDGRVCLFTPAGHVLLGYVRREDTHDGPAWFWSVSNDFHDDAEVGGVKRHQAVEALLTWLLGRGRR